MLEVEIIYSDISEFLMHFTAPGWQRWALQMAIISCISHTPHREHIAPNRTHAMQCHALLLCVCCVLCVRSHFRHKYLASFLCWLLHYFFVVVSSPSSFSAATVTSAVQYVVFGFSGGTHLFTGTHTQRMLKRSPVFFPFHVLVVRCVSVIK